MRPCTGLQPSAKPACCIISAALKYARNSSLICKAPRHCEAAPAAVAIRASQGMSYAPCVMYHPPRHCEPQSGVAIHAYRCETLSCSSLRTTEFLSLPARRAICACRHGTRYRKTTQMPYLRRTDSLAACGCGNDSNRSFSRKTTQFPIPQRTDCTRKR